MDISSKLKSSGLTSKDIKQVLDIIRAPAIDPSKATIEAVVGSEKSFEPEHGEVQPTAFQSNFAMKARAGSVIDVAEAHLSQALTDLKILLPEDEWESIEGTQEIWNSYRDSLAEHARQQFEGGTHAGLASALAYLAETERRIDEIRSSVERRKTLYI